MEGLDLLKQIIAATGLPPEAVEREMQKLLQRSSVPPEDLSLDDLRELLSLYLQEVLVEAKDAQIA
jgi:hypothetical protein